MGHDIYVQLAPGDSVMQRTFHDQVIFDLDANNKIIGVEILNARQVSIDGELQFDPREVRDS
jgi:uncharacterized protein YuzE